MDNLQASRPPKGSHDIPTSFNVDVPFRSRPIESSGPSQSDVGNRNATIVHLQLEEKRLLQERQSVQQQIACLRVQSLSLHEIINRFSRDAIRLQQELSSLQREEARVREAIVRGHWECVSLQKEQIRLMQKGFAPSELEGIGEQISTIDHQLRALVEEAGGFKSGIKQASLLAEHDHLKTQASALQTKTDGFDRKLAVLDAHHGTLTQQLKKIWKKFADIANEGRKATREGSKVYAGQSRNGPLIQDFRDP